ncbi:uncharacterized protein LOC141708004 isoform X2 [Apium graveolens]|uniref:uncharacterized protein LOC141708004 isoform X2 n=1 Tax=Apium graveolens TaxID=4045 RepID=UPI003D7923F4
MCGNCLVNQPPSCSTRFLFYLLQDELKRMKPQLILYQLLSLINLVAIWLLVTVVVDWSYLKGLTQKRVQQDGSRRDTEMADYSNNRHP